MLRIQLLGPVRAAGDLGAVPLRGVGQRVLLARLALSAGHVVSQEELITTPQGARSPATTRTLQSQVSRLRTALGEGARGVSLARQGHGYILQVPQDAVDAVRFEQLAADGTRALEDGAQDTASRLLASALGAWRGAALEDARATEWLDLAAIRLEEQRVLVTVRWLDAEVALGRHLSAIEPLARLVAQEPLHERAVELLMLSLYRSARQGEALATYRRTRRALRQELGVEPGPGLEALHQQILRQDQRLAAPAVQPREGQAPLGGLQIQKLEYVFKAMDLDGDGWLTAEDLARHADRLRALTGASGADGAAFSQDMAEWWAGVSRFSRGEAPTRVGRDDWLAFWAWSLGRVSADAGRGGGEFLSQMKASARLAFAVVDGDDDGHITGEDYAAWVRAWGFDFDAATVFEELDTDGDGLLSQDEVVHLVKDFYLTNDPEAPGNFIYGPAF